MNGIIIKIEMEYIKARGSNKLPYMPLLLVDYCCVCGKISSAFFRPPVVHLKVKLQSHISVARVPKRHH